MNCYEKLIKYSFFLLGKKRYTIFEIKQKLNQHFEKKYNKWIKEKNFLEEEIENNDEKEDFKNKTIKKIINRLLELKYLDDFSFAKDYISHSLELRPRGKFLLTRELKNKGIEEDIISENLLKFDIDEFEIAKKLLEKNKYKWRKSPSQKQKEKAFRFLASKGLNPDAILNALKEFQL